MADIRINSLPSTATSFNTDDYIAIDGASAGTRRMLAANPPFSDVTLGTSGPSVKSSLSARAPRQGLVFDGTSGATLTNYTFGTADFTASYWVRHNNAPTGGVYEAAIGATSGGLAINRTPSGIVEVSRSYVAAVLSGSSVLAAGKWYHVAVTRSGSSFVLYVNGVQDATATSSPDFNVSNGYLGSSPNLTTDRLNGILSQPLFYNRALSVSEVVALYEAGAPAGADYNSASNTAINTSNFVNGGTAYGTFDGVSATGFHAIKTAGTQAFAGSRPVFSVATGRRFLATFTATLTSGVAPTVFLANSTSGASRSGASSVAAGSNSVVLTTTSTDSSAALTFYNNPAEAAEFTISSVSLTPIGLLLAPDAAQAGGGLVWYDTSGNAANITLPASGVTWNVPTSGYVTSGSSLNLSAGGTNQNITLTPSGTGGTVIQSNANNGDVLLKLRATGASPNGAIRWTTNTDTYTVGIGSRFNIADNGLEFLIGSTTTGAALRSNGNYLIGTTTDRSNRVHIAAAGPSYIGMGQLTSTYAGIVFGDVTLADSASGFNIAGNAANSNLVFNVNTGGSMNWRVGNANAFTLSSASNLLIGTTIDGGQKLQVAGTAFIAASASSANIFFLRNTASNGYSTIQFEDTAGNAKGYIGYGNSGTPLFTSQFYIAAPTSIVLASGGGTTGLTLDSSQNATFAGTGTQTFNGLIHAKAGVSLTGGQILNLNLLGTAQILSSAANTINLNATTVAMGGALKLANAYTAGAPTATGYVTIQDSAGNTYKVLVGT